MEMITSHQNPLIKRIRRLRQKKYRQQEGAFFIEGLRIVLSAIEAQAEIDRLVYSPELLTSEVGWAAIRSQQERGGAADPVSGELFRKISNQDNPIGLGAILMAHMSSTQDLLINNESIFIGLIQISDPGNLGTVIRTANAANVSGVFLLDESVDPFHPTAVKASMGSLFTTPVCPIGDAEALLEWAAAKEIRIVASSARAELSFWDVDYELPTLLLVGSEKMGLSQQLLDGADVAVKIPMLGQATSLNLAVATGLILYEIRRSTGDSISYRSHLI
jgi:TrmH family RNA methyltransferase